MYQEVTKMVEAFEKGRLSRRELAAHLTALAVAVAAAPRMGAEEAGSTFEATGLDHIALRVTDVAHSRDFYIRHLGLTVSSDNSPANCFLNCGDNFVALFRGSEPGLDHFSFALDDYTAEGAVARLEAAGLAPKRRSDRVYFDDPDGIELQVSRGR